MLYLFLLIGLLLAYAFANPDIGSIFDWVLTGLVVMGIGFIASFLAEITKAEDISEELRD